MKQQKKPKRISRQVVVDLKELEWVKILEITVPPDLVWIGMIHMLRPVQFDRADLESLIGCIREQAASLERPRDRGALLRIADKLEKSMQKPASEPTESQAAAVMTPNNKQTAIHRMQQDLRQ